MREHDGEAPPDRRPRVLVVDDCAPLRAAVRVLLEDGSLEVVGEAGDGAAAIALAVRLQPDVAVLDVRMPGPDREDAGGLAVAAWLRRELPAVRVVFFTADVGPEVVHRAGELGAVAVLGKGVLPGALVEAVRAAGMPPGPADVLRGG